MVEELLDSWYGPEHVFFKVRADDGNPCILRHETSAPDGDWESVFEGAAGTDGYLPIGVDESKGPGGGASGLITQERQAQAHG